MDGYELGFNNGMFRGALIMGASIILFVMLWPVMFPATHIARDKERCPGCGKKLARCFVCGERTDAPKE
jgi:hypothetical protein